MPQLDHWFPSVTEGPCCCGKDIRHRLLGDICAEIADGATPEQVAEATGLPLEAVLTAVREWDPERGRPREAG